MSNPFSYTAREIANVERALSSDRFSSYMRAASGDPRYALRIYEWNVSVSAAFHLPLHTLEVGLRNACHAQLIKLFGVGWHDHPTFQTRLPYFVKEINNAKARLTRAGLPQDTPHIVAELNFGFWTTMLSRRYEQPLWNAGLVNAFPRYSRATGRKPERKSLALRFDYLRNFRNRIAHHEPIFKRALLSDYNSVIEASSWMHEDLSEWTHANSGTCRALLENGMPTDTLSGPEGWCGPRNLN